MVSSLSMSHKKEILIHICCAPDATYGVGRLSEVSGLKPVLLFYNPNIHPEEEYALRFRETEKVAAHSCWPLIADRYTPDAWLAAVRELENEPEGGLRCEVCFRLRLDHTAEKAAEMGCGAFSAVWTISPHKNAALINQLGEEASRKWDIPFINENLKKKDGFKESLKLSRELGLYRQHYCGCTFSDRGTE